jgi:hypothetical protein
MGDAAMRSNSGRDESRNNLRDPTLRDRENQRPAKAKGPGARTSELGSGARKSGLRGHTRETRQG